MPGLKVFTGSLWRAVGVEDSYWDVLTATAQGSYVNLTWPTAGGSPVSYEISKDDVVTNVGNINSYNVTGLTIGQSYNFKVRPIFSDGSTGGWSYVKSSGPNGFNSATGGTITTVANYNGTGQTWKIHSFTSSGTLSVTDAPGVNSFRVLAVGGGGNGGSSAGGGGGGGQVLDVTRSLTVSNYTVTIGSQNASSSLGSTVVAAAGAAGGAGREGAYSGCGGPGGTSGSGFGGGSVNCGGYAERGAGGGGAGAAGSGGTGGSGVSTNIRGSVQTFGGGGGGGGSDNVGPGGGGSGGGASGGCANCTGGSASANTGGGGGGGGVYYYGGGAGGSGLVVVSYRIA